MKRRDVLIGTGALVVATSSVIATNFYQMGSSDSYDESATASRIALSKSPDMQALIRFATLAASGHNAQPWRFHMADQQISLLPDFTRRTPIVDPDDHHLFVSLGCAAENLSLSAAACGKPGDIRFDTKGGGAVIFDFKEGASSSSALFDAIPYRRSTRTLYDGKSVSADDLQSLNAAALTSGVDMTLITDRSQIDRIRDLIIAANSVQMADKDFMNELKQWLRFNPRQAIAKSDGLYSAASGSPSLPSWLGPLMFDLVFKANTENENYARQLNSSSGIAVFVSKQADHTHWVQAGRACQRFALQATALGLKVAFMNQPIEVARFRPELAKLIGMPGRRPDIIMRFGYGPSLPLSLRRPVEAVIA